MRRMTMALAGCIVLTAGGWQCAMEGSPEGDEVVRLNVEPAEVRGGDEVTLVLVNASGEEIGYNLCPSVLDRREGSEWVERPERPAEFCTAELRILAPEDSATYTHTVPPGLPAGEYRFRAFVEAPLGEARVEVASHPFQIRSP